MMAWGLAVIEVQGKKTNKDNAIKSTLNSLKQVTPNKYTALSTYIEDTLSRLGFILCGSPFDIFT